MGIQCQILLTPSNKGVYKSGEPIFGIIRYVIDERMQFDSVFLRLKGKGKCYWQRHRGKEVYVSLQECVLRNKEIDGGAYEHHFKFDLPINIPSSFKDRICTISYKIVAEFSRPGLFTMTKKFDKEITVYGCLESRLMEPIIFGLTKTPFSCLSSGSQINVKVEIEKTLVMPGDNINLKYTIKNDTDLPVTGIKMKLIKQKTYISDNDLKYTSWRRDIDRSSVTSSGANKKSTVSSHCIVPTLPNLYSIYSKIFIREYKLHVTAILPFPHINASVEIPVVIGEKVNDEQRYPEDRDFVLYSDINNVLSLLKTSMPASPECSGESG